MFSDSIYPARMGLTWTLVDKGGCWSQQEDNGGEQP